MKRSSYFSLNSENQEQNNNKKKKRRRLPLSSSRHIKANDTFNVNSHVMTSTIVHMAPLNAASTSDYNRASLR